MKLTTKLLKEMIQQEFNQQIQQLKQYTGIEPMELYQQMEMLVFILGCSMPHMQRLYLKTMT